MLNKLNKVLNQKTFKSELSGILFNGNKATATDSFKLVELTLDEDTGLEDIIIKAQYKAGDKVKKQEDKPVIIRKDGSKLENLDIIAGQYPEYKQFFSEDTSNYSKVIINRKYLIDLLEAIPDAQVELYINNEKKPVYIKSKTAKAVLMPIL